MSEEHAHNHGEGCGCGHDHTHEHAHNHEHGEGCGHHHEGGCSHGQIGVPAVKTVDNAVVGSMRFEMPCVDKTAVEMLVTAELKRIQKAIEAQGGIVGHAKASFENKEITKISVVDAQATVDHVQAKTVTGEIAIIAFFVSEAVMSWLLSASNLH